MAVADFDTAKARKASQLVRQACEGGDAPSWTEDEQDVFLEHVLTPEITPTLRGKVLHNEINRGMRAIKENEDGPESV
jgi:hypothetical protein